MAALRVDLYNFWKRTLLNLDGEFDVARLPVLCDFLMRNDFKCVRQLRLASDPSTWEGADKLSSGVCLASF